jgi:hypothetical protein
MESEREESQLTVSQLAQGQKVTCRPSKIKKRLKKITRLLTFPWGKFILFVSFFVFIIILFMPTASCKAPPLPPKSSFPRIGLKTQKTNVNTTCIDYEPRHHAPIKSMVFRTLQENLLSKYHILCMHHLDLKDNIKLCVLQGKDNLFHLINPKITFKSNETQIFEENSISCKRPIVKERHKCIELSWLDYKGIFCNEVAFAVQLAMDEMEDEEFKFC